jgi:hypothetical protein
VHSAYVVDDDDWRLTGQEQWLTGVVLHRARWVRPREDWDHDHCEFCWKKIWDRASGDDEVDVGYETEDDSRWVCDDCFSDFKERFLWSVADHPDPGRRT